MRSWDSSPRVANDERRHPSSSKRRKEKKREIEENWMINSTWSIMRGRATYVCQLDEFACDKDTSFRWKCDKRSTTISQTFRMENWYKFITTYNVLKHFSFDCCVRRRRCLRKRRRSLVFCAAAGRNVLEWRRLFINAKQILWSRNQCWDGGGVRYCNRWLAIYLAYFAIRSHTHTMVSRFGVEVELLLGGGRKRAEEEKRKRKCE